MAEYSDELRAKLKKAQSLEEVTGLLKTDGKDVALAERLWTELTHKLEADAKELSLDELEAVSGGATSRDWFTEGCAATVEEGSECWGTDGGCIFVNIMYECMPNGECSICGSPAFRYWDENWEERNHIRYEKCRHCGNTHRAKTAYD